MDYQRKEIPNWSGYFADTEGNVWSIKTGDMYKRKLNYNKDGYPRLNLTKNGKGHNKLVHQLVLETFLGPRPKGMECCHYDGNPKNNKLENLRWDTPKNNKSDSVRCGTHAFGERIHSAKLNEFQVRVIRSFGKSNWRPKYKDIAAIFNIHPKYIDKIIKGEKWKYLNDNSNKEFGVIE